VNGFVGRHGFGLLFLAGGLLQLWAVTANSGPGLALGMVPLVVGGVGERLDHLVVGPVRVQLRKSRHRWDGD